VLACQQCTDRGAPGPRIPQFDADLLICVDVGPCITQPGTLEKLDLLADACCCKQGTRELRARALHAYCVRPPVTKALAPFA